MTVRLSNLETDNSIDPNPLSLNESLKNSPPKKKIKYSLAGQKLSRLSLAGQKLLHNSTQIGKMLFK